MCSGRGRGGQRAVVDSVVELQENLTDSNTLEHLEHGQRHMHVSISRRVHGQRQSDKPALEQMPHRSDRHLIVFPCLSSSAPCGIFTLTAALVSPWCVSIPGARRGDILNLVRPHRRSEAGFDPLEISRAPALGTLVLLDVFLTRFACVPTHLRVGPQLLVSSRRIVPNMR